MAEDGCCEVVVVPILGGGIEHDCGSVVVLCKVEEC
jgi:hypothetical protein